MNSPVSFTVAPLPLPLHMPFNISKSDFLAATNVLIQAKDGQGNVGLGEGAPFPVLTGDTQKDVLDVASAIAHELSGMTPQAALRHLYNRCWYDDTYARSTTAKVAIEMALLDLHARQLGVSFGALFGVEEKEVVETDLTLPILEMHQVDTFVHTFSAYGFKQFKIKVGGKSVSEDFERTEYLLSKLPKDVSITLDGNQGCSVDSALKLVKSLEDKSIHPLFFEQPLDEHDWNGLVELSAKCPIPICLDETVKTAADAVRAVQLKCCQLINLKFTKSGIREAFRIATVARSAGLGVMIGGMVESEIAMTASLHFVAGSGLVDWCDLDTPFFLSKHPTEASPYHDKTAMLRVPKGKGIGLELIA